MPLVYQQDINEDAKIGVWHITETDTFFLKDWTPLIAIKNERKHIQHLAGRYLLKVLQPDFPLQDILVSQNGMPYLIDGNCFFSISHCDDYAAVIINKNQKVGIDIESVRPKIGLIKDKFLTESELDLLQSSGLELSIQYTIGWTIKEALFKWYGKGNVDFRKNLILKSFDRDGDCFLFDAIFCKEDQFTTLQIRTIMFQEKIMSWIV